MVKRAAAAHSRYRKTDLPRKTCLACGRPFEWRKKWRAVWDEVKTCSERCKGDWRARKSTSTTLRCGATGPR